MYDNHLFAEQLLYWIETLGILAFALSGVILARQKDFDIVGVYIIAWVTAFGGGTIRDVVLDIQPVYWIAHAEYPLMLLGLIIVISLLKKIQIKSSWLLVPDAMGMALFAISTAQNCSSSWGTHSLSWLFCPPLWRRLVVLFAIVYVRTFR